MSKPNQARVRLNIIVNDLDLIALHLSMLAHWDECANVAPSDVTDRRRLAQVAWDTGWECAELRVMLGGRDDASAAEREALRLAVAIGREFQGLCGPLVDPTFIDQAIARPPESRTPFADLAADGMEASGLLMLMHCDPAAQPDYAERFQAHVELWSPVLARLQAFVDPLREAAAALQAEAEAFPADEPEQPAVHPLTTLPPLKRPLHREIVAALVASCGPMAMPELLAAVPSWGMTSPDVASVRAELVKLRSVLTNEHARADLAKAIRTHGKNDSFRIEWAKRADCSPNALFAARRETQSRNVG